MLRIGIGIGDRALCTICNSKNLETERVRAAMGKETRTLQRRDGKGMGMGWETWRGGVWTEAGGGGGGLVHGLSNNKPWGGEVQKIGKYSDFIIQ